MDLAIEKTGAGLTLTATSLTAHPLGGRLVRCVMDGGRCTGPDDDAVIPALPAGDQAPNGVVVWKLQPSEVCVVVSLQAIEVINSPQDRSVVGLSLVQDGAVLRTWTKSTKLKAGGNFIFKNSVLKFV